MEKHTTVLLTEAVDALAITEDSIVVDATVGACGHAMRIIDALGPEGVYLGIDADTEAIASAEKYLSGESKIILRQGNFKDIDSILNENHIGTVDAVLADLGWRMEQFSGNGKGFSFRVDEPLYMTYGTPDQYPFTAYDVVNEWEEASIINILEGYGEERYARRIAHAIVAARSGGEIRTSVALATIIERAVPQHYRHGKIHPATRTFQAIRIAVNDELGVLQTFMHTALNRLSEGGRLAIITFHSLEDRVVKHTMRAYVQENRGMLVTKKPILPTREEIIHNPRARSAKLRVFIKHENRETYDTV